MRQTRCPCRRHNLIGFERLQEAIDHTLRSAIPLEPYYPPKLAATVLAFSPTFEHIGGVRIKLATIFASWSAIGSHTFVEPLPHGSRFHSKTNSNLWSSQSLLTPGEHLLIPLLSLCTPRGNGLLHAFLLRGPPFFNRQEAVCARLHRSLCSLAGRFALQEDTCEELLDGFRQVLCYMEAISHLNRLRSAGRYRAGVLTAAIAAHMGNFGMRFHPGRCGFLLTVRQEITYVVPLQIHQHRAKGSAPAEREVVHTQMHHLVRRLCGKLHDSTQDTCPRDLYPQTRTQACSQASARGQANGFDLLTQSGGQACPGLQKSREPFREDFPWTIPIRTKEFAHVQDQLRLMASTCQISSFSSIVAVHA